MEHDHQSSKAEGKAAGTWARRNPTSYLSSDARAVFDLQQAAGNRAVAKMLTSSASGTKLQRSPLDPPSSGSVSPISVQRLKFDDALDEVVTDKSQFEIKDFASSLLKVATNAPAPEAVVNKVTQDVGTGKTATDSKAKKAPKVVLTKEQNEEKLAKLKAKRQPMQGPKTKEEAAEEAKAQATQAEIDKLEAEEAEEKEADELKQREADLKGEKKKEELSPLAKQNQAKKEELDRLEKEKKARETEQKAKDDQAAKLKKLKTPLTPEAKRAKEADQAQKDEIEDLEQEQTDEEARRKYMRKLRTPAVTPGQVKSLRNLF